MVTCFIKSSYFLKELYIFVLDIVFRNIFQNKFLPLITFDYPYILNYEIHVRCNKNMTSIECWIHTSIEMLFTVYVVYNFPKIFLKFNVSTVNYCIVLEFYNFNYLNFLKLISDLTVYTDTRRNLSRRMLDCIFLYATCTHNIYFYCNTHTHPHISHNIIYILKHK